MRRGFFPFDLLKLINRNVFKSRHIIYLSSKSNAADQSTKSVLVSSEFAPSPPFLSSGPGGKTVEEEGGDLEKWPLREVPALLPR